MKTINRTTVGLIIMWLAIVLIIGIGYTMYSKPIPEKEGAPAIDFEFYRINDSMTNVAVVDTMGIILFEEAVHDYEIEEKIEQFAATILTPYIVNLSVIDENSLNTKCLLSIIDDADKVYYQIIKYIPASSMDTLMVYYYDTRFASLPSAKYSVTKVGL